MKKEFNREEALKKLNEHLNFTSITIGRKFSVGHGILTITNIENDGTVVLASATGHTMKKRIDDDFSNEFDTVEQDFSIADVMLSANETSMDSGATVNFSGEIQTFATFLDFYMGEPSAETEVLDFYGQWNFRNDKLSAQSNDTIKRLIQLFGL